MGYNFKIGEHCLEHVTDEQSYDDEECCRVYAIGVALPDAPKSEYNEGSNSWSPSYTGWHNFATETKLLDVFPGNRDQNDLSLVVDHPGWAKLDQRHLDRFREAREGLSPDDYNSTRLDWLIFWTDWALKNCKRPIFTNS